MLLAVVDVAAAELEDLWPLQQQEPLVKQYLELLGVLALLSAPLMSSD